MNNVLTWLLESDEPWTRYRTLLDLLGRSETDAEVQAARAAMLAHPQVQGLITEAMTWGQRPFKRHNDAGYPIYKFSTLADFGVRATDPGMQPLLEMVLAHQSADGVTQSLLNIPKAFGGTNEDIWTWAVCDAPTLLYALLAFGMGEDPRVKTGVAHLAGTVSDNGWRCVTDSGLGKFRGPGRKDDPCPIANVYMLKMLATAPDMGESPAARAGVEMLLEHWGRRGEWRPYLFGVGSDFGKLKYPCVWYDILHVTDVLSRFPFAREDARFREMAQRVAAQAGDQGRYTATSMYRTWAGWSFSDKKQPSPWLTFLALRMLSRSGPSSG
ncbi:MAG: hypothetical protein JXA21_27020 [Anaerolineae bacterium]|nr:hypothetical protein [Anaerolineae bacterium]